MGDLRSGSVAQTSLNYIGHWGHGNLLEPMLYLLHIIGTSPYKLS